MQADNNDPFEAWNKVRVGTGVARYPALENWVKSLQESIVFVRKAELVRFDKLGADGRYCIKVAAPTQLTEHEDPSYSAELSLNITSVDSSMLFGLLKECEVLKLARG